MGKQTERLAQRGLLPNADRDTIREVQLYGGVYDAETVRAVDGGEALLGLLSKRRQSRRGFVEAFTTGSWLDFAPYLGDLATFGVSVRNMKKARDAHRKLAEDPNSLTLDEKVLLAVQEENAMREQTQTIWGLVGSIARRAPAFALEFLTSGAIFKGAAKALGFGAKSAATMAAKSSAKYGAVAAAKNMVKEGAERATLEFTKETVEKLADDAVLAALRPGLSLGDELALKATAKKTVELTLNAYKNPSHFRNLGSFIEEYGKRGFLGHLDNVVRDLPGILPKLREAAGVAFVEAPIKGGLYSAFDFLAVNPVAAKLMGAEEAVTEAELGLYATGEKRLMDNAKMLAFGSAWAEYASENSGRAFSAIGGVLFDDIGGAVSRKVMRHGLRATKGQAQTLGKGAREMLEALGTPGEMRAGLAGIRRNAVEAALMPGGALAGTAKGVDEVLKDPALVKRAMKTYLGFRDKSFLGYYIASKSVENNLTPGFVAKTLQNMGYDDIMEEFMEERYSGFASGLFGLDGEEHDGNLRRIAHAMKSSLPGGGGPASNVFKHGMAEIMAFALPSIGRAVHAKSFEVLGAGSVGKAMAVAETLDMLQNSKGVRDFSDDAPAAYEVRTSDAESGSVASELRQKLGKARASAGGLAQEKVAWDNLTSLTVDVARRMATGVPETKGLMPAVVQGALGIINFALSGNPFSFRNPTESILYDRLGNDGRYLVNRITAAARGLYRQQQRIVATASAAEAAAEGKSREEQLAELRRLDPKAELPALEKAETTGEAAFDNPEVWAAIQPMLEKAARAAAKNFLNLRGAVIVDKQDADSVVSRLKDADTGKVAGLEESEFRKKFSQEIEEAAAGHLTLDVSGDRVLVTYKRTPGTVTEFAKGVEAMFSRMGIRSVVDVADTDAFADSLRATAAEPLDMDLVDLAASDLKTPEAEAARMQIVTMVYTNPLLGDLAAWGKRGNEAAELARVIKVANGRVLRPQFTLPGKDGADDTRIEVFGNRGAYYLGYANGTRERPRGTRLDGNAYATVAEAAGAVPAGAVRNKSQIYLTPSQTTFYGYAALMFARDAGAFSGYLDLAEGADAAAKADAAALSASEVTKFETLKEAVDYVTAGMAAATDWITRGRPADDAEGQAAYKKWLADPSKAADREAFGDALGIETAAQHIVESRGFRREPRPDVRGATGYAVDAAALNFEGAVYMPYEHLGTVSAIIEDSVERLLKEPQIMALFWDRAAGAYRAPVRAFFAAVSNQLGKYLSADSAEVKAVTSDPASREALTKSAAMLWSMFTPEPSANQGRGAPGAAIEALAHAITGIVHMRGDAAARKLDRNVSAFYDVLGLIAPAVRSDVSTYDPFVSLVDRAYGGAGLLDAASAEASPLAGLMKAFVPSSLRDNAGAVFRSTRTDDDTFTPVTDHLRTAANMEARVALNLTGVPSSGLSGTTDAEREAEKKYLAGMLARRLQSSEDGGDVLMPEEYDGYLRELQGQRNDRLLREAQGRLGAAEAAEAAGTPDAAEAANEQAEQAKLGNDSRGPEDPSASIAATFMTDQPALAVLLAREYLREQNQDLPADPPKALESVFNLWKTRDPLLSPGDKDMFLRAAEESGVTARLEVLRVREVEATMDEYRGRKKPLGAVFMDVLEDLMRESWLYDEGYRAQYDEGFASSLLEQSRPARAVDTVLRLGFRHSLDDAQAALVAMYRASAGMYKDGAADLDSLASLFNEAAWSNKDLMHPALVSDRAFSEWISKERKETADPRLRDLLTLLRVLGRQGTFSAADVLKGARATGIYTVRVRVDANNVPMSRSDPRFPAVEFSRMTRSASGNSVEQMRRDLKANRAGLQERAAKAHAMLLAEVKLGFAGRLARLGEAADLLFGERSTLGEIFRDPDTLAMLRFNLLSEGGENLRAWVGYESPYESMPAGILANRMTSFANYLRKGGKDLDHAMSVLFRGDAFGVASGKGGALQNPAGNRGAFGGFLNRVAEMTPVAEARRVGGDGSKVKARAPALSNRETAFLESEAFRRAYSVANGTFKEAGLDDALRTGRWPDGTPVFSGINGETREFAGIANVARAFTRKISEPVSTELGALTRQHYNDNSTSLYDHFLVYKAGKSTDRLVTVPRVALPALLGLEARPDYETARVAVGRMLELGRNAPKRGAQHMFRGPGVTARGAVIAVLVPMTEAGAADKKAAEDLHGQLLSGDPGLANYAAALGFDHAAKLTYGAAMAEGAEGVDDVWVKGATLIASRGEGPGKVDPDLRRIALAGKYLAMPDQDAMKEGPLYYRDASGERLLDALLAGKTEGVFSSPGGYESLTLQEFVEKYKIVVKDESVNGTPVKLVEMTSNVRVQMASPPINKAGVKRGSLGINIYKDHLAGVWKSAAAQVGVERALAARLRPSDPREDPAFMASLPPAVRSLIESGVSLSDPAVMSVVGPKLASLASKVYDTKIGSVRALQDNWKARAVTDGNGNLLVGADGKVVHRDSYNALRDATPDGAIHDGRELTEAESAEMHGAKRVPASTAFNGGSPTFRYGLRLNAKALGLTNPADMAAAVERRVLALHAAALKSQAEDNDDIYLWSYASNIEGAFLDRDGKPLPAGMLLSFADLVDSEGRFRREAVEVAPGGEYVRLTGEQYLCCRTPSENGLRSESAFTAWMPAYMEKADGSQFYVAVSVDAAEGTVKSVRVPYPVGTLVPGRDSVLLMTPTMKDLAGSDEDWDIGTALGFLLDRLGRRVQRLNNAEALIEAAESDAEAKAIYDRAVNGLANEMFLVMLEENLGHERLLRAVSAKPFSDAHAATLEPRAEFDQAGPSSDAEDFRNAQIAGPGRAIAVAEKSNLLMARVVGLEHSGGAVSEAPVLGVTQVGNKPRWTETRLREFIYFADDIANSTFDDLKEGTSYRAFLRPETLDLFLFLCYESGAESRAEFEELHSRFMKWARSADGKRFEEAYRNESDPAGFGGKKLADEIQNTRYALLALAKEEQKEADTAGKAPWVYRAFRALGRRHQDLVAAMMAGDTSEEEYRRHLPLIRTYNRMSDISALGGVLSYKKADVAFPADVKKLEGQVEKVEGLLDSPVHKFAAPDTVASAVAMAKAKAEDARAALKGSLEFTPVYESVMKRVDYKTARDNGFASPREMARAVVLQMLPAEAAAALTPAATGELIEAAVPGSPNRPAALLALTETAFNAMFAGYAAAMNAKDSEAPAVALFDTLLAPSLENKATRIILASADGTDAALQGLQRSARMFRDNDPALAASGVAEVTLDLPGSAKKLKVTPSDLYWLLLNYAAATAELSVNTSRESQSILRGVFGDQVYRQISDYVIEGAKGEFNLEEGTPAFFSSGTGMLSGTPARRVPLKGLPDGFARMPPAADTRQPEAAREAAVMPAPEETPEAPAAKVAPAAESAQSPADTKPQGLRVKTRLGVPKAEEVKGPFKSERATKGIMHGDGSTGYYRGQLAAAGIPVNQESYSAGDVVFVSVNGTPEAGDLAAAVRQSKAALEAGATLLTDSEAYLRTSVYNKGERALAAELLKSGYARTTHPGNPDVGVWTKPPADTKASAAVSNVKSWASRIASAKASARRMESFAADAAGEAKSHSGKLAGMAEQMGQALRSLSDTPWMRSVPGGPESMAAAERLLRLMRYPEPAVFIGALRAAGRSAVANNIEDAVPELRALIVEAGAAKSGDRARIGLLAGAHSSAILAASPELRVMAFAVASADILPKADAAAKTGAVAARILKGLGVEASFETAETAEPPSVKDKVAPDLTAKNQGTRAQRTVTRQKWITRDDLKKNPDTIYLFGDNLAGYGLGGQAKAMRGEPNAVGVPTKKLPSTAANAFMSDAEYENNVRAIDAALARIPAGAPVVIPEDGLGTGLARLDQTAPRTFAYLQQKLADLSAGSASIADGSPTPMSETPSVKDKVAPDLTAKQRRAEAQAIDSAVGYIEPGEGAGAEASGRLSTEFKVQMVPHAKFKQFAGEYLDKNKSVLENPVSGINTPVTLYGVHVHADPMWHDGKIDAGVLGTDGLYFWLERGYNWPGTLEMLVQFKDARVIDTRWFALSDADKAALVKTDPEMEQVFQEYQAAHAAFQQMSSREAANANTSRVWDRMKQRFGASVIIHPPTREDPQWQALASKWKVVAQTASGQESPADILRERGVDGLLTEVRVQFTEDRAIPEWAKTSPYGVVRELAAENARNLSDEKDYYGRQKVSHEQYEHLLAWARTDRSPLVRNVVAAADYFRGERDLLPDFKWGARDPDPYVRFLMFERDVRGTKNYSPVTGASWFEDFKAPQAAFTDADPVIRAWARGVTNASSFTELLAAARESGVTDDELKEPLGSQSRYGDSIGGDEIRKVIRQHVLAWKSARRAEAVANGREPDPGREASGRPSTVRRIAAETSPEAPLVVYADGSDIKGTGRLGYGAWARHAGAEYVISGTNESAEGRALQARFPGIKMSNPTMEMLALVSVVESFRGTPVHLHVRQDYKGAMNYDGLWQRGVQNAQRDPKPWKAKEAYVAYLRDRAVAAIESIETAGGSVRIEWVKGHQTGTSDIATGNDNADRAAKSRDARNDFSPGEGADGEPAFSGPTASLAVASVTPGGEVALTFSWHAALAALPDRIKRQQTLAQQLQRIRAPRDEAAAFLKWAEGKTGDSAELLAQYEAEVLPKLEIARRSSPSLSGTVYVENADGVIIYTAPNAQAALEYTEQNPGTSMRSYQQPEYAYEGLSVNKGQGEYKEYFIKTPFPVPGQHGRFEDPNLAGWFRVRENTETGVLEIQEIQSELFQKNKGGFGVTADSESFGITEADAAKAWSVDHREPLGSTAEFVGRKGALYRKIDGEWRVFTIHHTPEQAAFLNLMLKDQTWVPVFVNAITQWARNQGFTKVRFPTGETAARVEGHQVLADRLTELQEERDIRAAAITADTPISSRSGPVALPLFKSQYTSRLNAYVKVRTGEFIYTDWSVIKPAMEIEAAREMNERETRRRVQHYFGGLRRELTTEQREVYEELALALGIGKNWWSAEDMLRYAVLDFLPAERYSIPITDGPTREGGQTTVSEAYNRERFATRISTIDAEIQNLKTQGIEKLAPIEAFYEKRVAAIVNRMGAQLVSDTNSNTWREVATASLAQQPQEDPAGQTTLDAIDARFPRNMAVLREPDHTYLINGGAFESVTTLIRKDPAFAFNEAAVAARKAGKTGIEAEVFLAQWAAARDEGLRIRSEIELMVETGIPSKHRGVAELVAQLKLRGEVLSGRVLWGSGVAGSVGALVIRPDGSVELYGAKTMDSNPHAGDYYETYKAEAHRVQMLAYARMLEGAGITVSGAYIIPVDRDKEALYRRGDGSSVIDAAPTAETFGHFDRIFGDRVLQPSDNAASFNVDDPAGFKAQMELIELAGKETESSRRMMDDMIRWETSAKFRRRRYGNGGRLASLMKLSLESDLSGGLAEIEEYAKSGLAALKNLRVGQAARDAMVSAVESVFMRPDGGMRPFWLASARSPLSLTDEAGTAYTLLSYKGFQQKHGNLLARVRKTLSAELERIDAMPDKAARDSARQELEDAYHEFRELEHMLHVASVLLRPNVREGGAYKPNPLREKLLKESKVDLPPGGHAAPEMPPDIAAAVQSAVDPDTGDVDPWHDLTATYVTSESWFYNTVFPVFRGADARRVLFDKESMAAQFESNRVGQAMDAYFGVDSDTGYIRKSTRIKGLAAHLGDGGFTVEGEGADVRYYERRKLVKEAAGIALGNAFTDEEFSLAYELCKAIHAYAAGGRKAKLTTSAEIRFSDLPWHGEGMTPDKLAALVSFGEAARRQGNEVDRPYYAHFALQRVRTAVLPVFHAGLEKALQDAVRAGALTPGNAHAKEQAALASLEESGYATARHRLVTSERGGKPVRELFSVNLAVPVMEVARVFHGSSAKRKLVDAGRDDAFMTADDNGESLLEVNAAKYREAYAKLEKSHAALSWMTTGIFRSYHDIGTRAGFFKGPGSFHYHARRQSAPATPEFKDAVMRAYDSLRSLFPAMRNPNGTWRDAADVARYDWSSRMFELLRDLHPHIFDSGADRQAVWQTVAENKARSIGLDAESTGWDVAVAVYNASVAALHESAWRNGAPKVTDIQTIGLEAFNRAIGEAAVSDGDMADLRGASFEQIYDATGALAHNHTAGSALVAHGREMAALARYRGTLNQLLMTADENGMPLYCAKPGLNTADDTVPDEMWGMLARWWADSYTDANGNGVAYEASASGRENASRIYDLVTPGKVSEHVKQTASGGLMRYTFSQVELPPGQETFAAIAAAKDKAGDDTKSVIDAHSGGEANNIMTQVLALGHYNAPDGKAYAVWNRALTWSKSASVMASLFFPIATAFESPVGAVGLAPTLLGLTKPGVYTARWMKDNAGWLARLLGVDDVSKAPFMSEILRVIGSDDPALTDLKVQGVLAGLTIQDRIHNVHDQDRSVIERDINATVAKVKSVFGSRASKNVKALMEAALMHPSEFAFEYVINAAKLAVFAQMNERLRQRAIRAGRAWDPVRDMRKYAHYINAEVGGIDPAVYPWLTPKMQRWLKGLMFSWEWTLGAWDAAGGGLVTGRLFGRTMTREHRALTLGRWVRMYGAVMIGIPFVLQMMGVGLAKALGQGDPDDKLFSWDNEPGKQGKYFDLTPWLRAMANAPLVGTLKLKRKLPETVLGLPFGALLPGLTGQEGPMTTTRKRRYYGHFGKQGWEIAGWLANPVRAALSKMSMPAQKMLEGVLGISPATGWAKPWGELGFWERWLSLDPETSATLNLGTAFLPFSMVAARRTPEAGALTALMPVGKGISKTRARKDMAKMFAEWADAKTYSARHAGRPGAWSDLQSMASEWLEALRLNGYQPEETLKDAITDAREPLYEQVHKALPTFPDERVDTQALEEAARGLYRLNFIARDLLASIKSRDKGQNIKRVGDLSEITNEALREAFSNPYGRRRGTVRDAARGGDVLSFLATDALPATVLGYKVVKPEELSEADLQYFKDNPQAAGHFDMAGGGGPARDAERAGVVDEILSAPAYKKPAPPGTPAELVRIDGTAKGAGYFGSVPYTAVPGDYYMTEQSIGHAHELRPLLVPTLTPDELVKASLGTPDRAMFEKADRHAADRLRAGKPVWARPGEQSPPHPGLLQMLDTLRKKKGTK